MASYFTAYGLNIHSEIDLLLPATSEDSAPDLTIRYANFTNVSLENLSWDGVWYEYHGRKQLTLKWDIIGSYLITSGNEVLINPTGSVNDENIRLPILGTIMAMVLQQRGCIVLHGSAVLMNEQVVIFAGNKGQGKSTLAAWLNHQGFPLLSDDVCAMDSRDKQPLSIRPAFPRIRLNPDVLLHLGDTPDHYPQVHPEVPKRICDMDEGFCTSPSPVGAVCVLESGEEMKLEQLHGMDAVKEILTHMLINRFPENQPDELRETIFAQSAKTAQTIPVYRLTRPRDLQLLPETTRLLQGLATRPSL
jgi:hypothetical protein